ncbi:MAG: protein kinase domain-containing protein [Anaerolineae bacterium]
MSFVAGETVGPYRISEQLGSGGMATVFKAYHASLDRYVAIKVLHPAFKEDPNFLARFQREARVVARLEHPNIVPVYDYNDHSGQPYLVMRYVEGETLKARLARDPLSLEEILKVVHSVGVALIYAHGQGVLHRDIKPSNVMLTPKGDVFLTDFGLARIAQAGESTLSQDSVLGTPQYISPEQARGDRDLDVRTDVYSLGVVVYELLVGRVPYQADTPYAVVHDHIFTPLPMPRSINPNLSEPLERFLLKTLSKDRADRFQSIEDMLAGLNRAVAESGIKLSGSISTIIQPDSAPTLAAAPQLADAPAAATSKKPVSPLVWIGLGALIVIAIVAVLLLARPRQIPAAPIATRNPPANTPAPVDNPPPDPGQTTRQILGEANAFFRQGNDLVLQARPDEARATFQQAAEKAEEGLGTLSAPGTPAEGELHVLAAESWLASGHPDRAEPHFDWLVESAQDKAKPLTGLALAYLLQDRVDDALHQADEALAGNADLPEAHAVKGCGLLKSGDRLAAGREFRQAAANASGPTVIPPWVRLVLEQLDCKMQR